MPLDDGDVSYVRREFVPLEEACARADLPLPWVRAMMHRGRLPKPPYVLPDGTEMVAADHFVLFREAGSIGRMQQRFVDRFTSLAAELGEPASPEEARQAWTEYLSGEYFVCLRHATPENIVRKGSLVGGIEELLETPREDEGAWREELGSMVDELDDLERPFAAYDRLRFGAPSSRDRLITAIRRQYLSRPRGSPVSVPPPGTVPPAPA